MTETTFDALTSRTSHKNTRAEKGFLLSCMQGTPDPLIAGLALLKADHFTDPLHRAIWEKLVTLDIGEVVESGPLAVAYSLPSDLAEPAFRLLCQYWDQGSLYWYKTFIETIDKCLRYRLAKDALAKGLDTLDSDDPDPQRVAEDTQARMGEVLSASENALHSPVSAFEEAKVYDDTTLTGKVLSGVNALAEVTGPFRPGELIVLGARPAVGKSALALNYLVQNSIRGNLATLLFTIEMTAAEVGTRLMPLATGIPYNRFRQGFNQFDPTPFAKCRFHIDDRSVISVSQMAAQAEAVKQRTGLDFVIVDYCQLVKPAETRNATREQQIAQISRDLKILAKHLGVPILMLAQLGRAVERDNREPRLADLRESGAIEQDANKVMFLHRPDFSVPADNVIIVAKNRAGRPGRCSVQFNGETMRFS